MDFIIICSLKKLNKIVINGNRNELKQEFSKPANDRLFEDDFFCFRIGVKSNKYFLISISFFDLMSVNMFGCASNAFKVAYHVYKTVFMNNINQYAMPEEM